MFSSFFSGISGLMANSYAINVVGNNISQRKHHRVQGREGEL